VKQPHIVSTRTRSETAKPSIFWLLAVAVIPLVSVIARFRIHDAHKLPKKGAFVLAPNHCSEIDPVIMGTVMWKLRRLPHFLAKASLFNIPVVGGALRASGQIPVERAGSVTDPLKAAKELFEKERMVIVYPEGTLTRDPDLWPMRGKTGVVRLALEHGLIPAAHWGTQKLMARYSKKISFFPRKTVDVKIGDPVDLTAFANRPLDAATLSEATAYVMDAITHLLEDLRHEKAPPTRWNPADSRQKETGRFDA
jgi:1-acyl-sn-glycerol-3-phosphate acyltransferase